MSKYYEVCFHLEKDDYNLLRVFAKVHNMTTSQLLVAITKAYLYSPEEWNGVEAFASSKKISSVKAKPN